LGKITVSEKIRNLVPYVAGKPIEEVERELGISNIIKLASNENPLGPSPRALEAGRQALENVRMYPEGSCHVLRTKLAEKLNVPADWLMFGNGSDDMIHCLGLTFLTPDDEVVTGNLTFSQYAAAAHLTGATLREVPMKDEAFDLEAMAEAFNEKTRLVFIANPNNPTGTIVSRTQLEKLISRLPERAILVLDEAYNEYIDAPDFPQSLDYVRQGKNVVALRTFSKIYALAGLRVGYGVASPEITDYVNRVREPFNVNLVAQYAATAALDDVEYVKNAKRLNAEGKARLYEGFQKLGLRYARSQANFVWVDFGRDTNKVCDALMRLGVIIRPGSPFGAPTCGRVTIGTPEQNERFLKALEQVLS